MTENIVISGSGSELLGQSVSKLTNSKFFEIDSKNFPDNEVYVRIPTDVSNKNVYVIQTMVKSHLLLSIQEVKLSIS